MDTNWYIHPMEYYSVIKRNKLDTLVPEFSESSQFLPSALRPSSWLTHIGLSFHSLHSVNSLTTHPFTFQMHLSLVVASFPYFLFPKI